MRTMNLGIVDHDVDLGTDFGRKLLHRPRIGDIQRNQGDLRQRRQLGKARVPLPWFGVPDPDQVRARRSQRARQRLPYGTLSISYKDFSKLRVAGHFTQLPVICHVRYFLIGKCHEHRHSRSIQFRANQNAARRRVHVAVQMHDHCRATIQPHHAQSPRNAFAEKEIVTVSQQSLGDELATSILRDPGQVVRQASMTSFPRWILNRTAAHASL